VLCQLKTGSRKAGRLHDLRTSDLQDSILAHESQGSQANRVIDNFLHLNETEKQDLLNFLRPL